MARSGIPREFVNDYIFNFPDTSFAWAFVLALLAAALAARKRIAWWILLLYLAGSIVWNIVDLVTGPRDSMADDIGELIGLVVHVAALVLLVLARNEFWAKVRRGALFKAAARSADRHGDRHRRRLGPARTVSRHTGPRTTGCATRPTGSARSPAPVPNCSTVTIRTCFVNALLGLFGALALMAAAVVLFQSQRSENALTGEDESAIRGLLEVYGKNDSLGYFATRRDKSVVFAPNGRAAVTYRVEVGVCLASGDPTRRSTRLAAGHRRLAAAVPGLRLGPRRDGCEFRWRPRRSARPVSTRSNSATRRSCIRTRYKLSGPDMKPVRQAVTRARRAGLTVRIRRHRELSADEMALVVKRADAWRDTETERGFSMALGRLGDPADADCLLVEAVSDRAAARSSRCSPWCPGVPTASRWT